MLKRFLSLGLAGVFALGLLSVDIQKAEASNLRLCAPIRAGAAPGPTNWVATSGTRYSLNARGCGLIAYTDVGSALGAGFTIEAPFGSMTRTLIASSSSSTPTFTLPASAYIQQIILAETSGASVTGGIMIGTTSGGNDVVKAISANSGQFSATIDSAAASAVATTIMTSPDWTLRRRAFSKTVQQNLFVDSPNSFNGAGVDVTIIYGFF